MRLSSLFSNESEFGKMMTRIGIVISANILFCIFCLPVITIGPAYTALYHVIMKMIRTDGKINPLKEYWTGFRENFRQAAAAWTGIIFLAAFSALDIYWCHEIGGALHLFQYAIYGIVLLLLILAVNLFPVTAFFSDTLPHLIRNAFYFAIRNPLITVFLVLSQGGLLYLTVMHPKYLPVTGFVWVTCGWGVLVRIGAGLFLPLFDRAFIEAGVETTADTDDTEERSHEKTEEEILKEMERLG